MAKLFVPFHCLRLVAAANKRTGFATGARNIRPLATRPFISILFACYYKPVLTLFQIVVFTFSFFCWASTSQPIRNLPGPLCVTPAHHRAALSFAWTTFPFAGKPRTNFNKFKR